MQLLQRLASAPGDYTLLWDSSAPVPNTGFDGNQVGPAGWPDFEPSFAGTGQQDPSFTTPGVPQPQFRQPLSNVVCILPVELQVAYATSGAALLSLATFAALMEVLSHFQIKDGAAVLYIPNATVLDYKARKSNVAVTHMFTIKGDTVTTVAPA